MSDAVEQPKALVMRGTYKTWQRGAVVTDPKDITDVMQRDPMLWHAITVTQEHPIFDPKYQENQANAAEAATKKQVAVTDKGAA